MEAKGTDLKGSAGSNCFELEGIFNLTLCVLATVSPTAGRHVSCKIRARVLWGWDAGFFLSNKKYEKFICSANFLASVYWVLSAKDLRGFTLDRWAYLGLSRLLHGAKAEFDLLYLCAVSTGTIFTHGKTLFSVKSIDALLLIHAFGHPYDETGQS